MSLTCWGQITVLETAQQWLCQEMQAALQSERISVSGIFFLEQAAHGGLPLPPPPSISAASAAGRLIIIPILQMREQAQGGKQCLHGHRTGK